MRGVWNEMKRYMKSFSKKVKVRGVIVSTEIILILSAVIILSFVAMLGLGRIVMNQAVSTKATITVNEAQGWYYGVDDKFSNNKFITVTFYVTNLGDKAVKISSVEVIAGKSGRTLLRYVATDIDKQVNPGETISISLKLTRNPSSGSYTNSIMKQTIMKVTYTDADGRTNTIEVPIVITHA